MSYRTDRLAELFPQIYAARTTDSLLHKLLDAIGAELLDADDTVRELLTSHWIGYASGPALDGLSAIFGVTRRTLPNGSLESDEAFRLRLRAVVRLFTGGGTRRAVLGAVRSALGLPFDLDQLRLPPSAAGLREALERLITIEEFSPQAVSISEERVTLTDTASELVVVIDMFTAREERPRIEWTFTSSSARLLSLELRGSGESIISTGDLRFKAGQTLVLSAGDDGRLRAQVGASDVTSFFTDMAGRRPVLPKVPQGRSEWVFRAGSGFDTGFFDDDTYDLPRFRVEMHWVRYETLAFDVYAPYFLKQTVEQLAQHHEYHGELFVYEGLPLERIQEVVDQTHAAGVRGSVHFSLNFFEEHNQREQPLMIAGDHRADEDSRLDESLLVGSVSSGLDTHDIEESFAVGGVFDISTFDQGHGFVD